MANRSEDVKNDATETNDAKEQNTDAFLEKVMIRSDLPDVFDARDITEVVFRTMRDMISNEITEKVAAELHCPASKITNREMPDEMSELWVDTNPIVRYISKVRPILDIDDQLFIRRIKQEGGVPKKVSIEQVITAVFATTKEQLPESLIKEIGEFLPGTIKTMWLE